MGSGDWVRRRTGHTADGKGLQDELMSAVDFVEKNRNVEGQRAREKKRCIAPSHGLKARQAATPATKECGEAMRSENGKTRHLIVPCGWSA